MMEPPERVTTRAPLQNCPNCGTPLEAHSTPDGKPGPAPKAGDYTVCFRCAAVMKIGDDQKVRGLTGEEYAEFILDPPPELERVVRAIRYWQAMKQ
jgi:hypothetical protein